MIIVLITIAAMNMKKYYDTKHLPRFYSVGDPVRLRLGRGYAIPETDILAPKLGPQFTQALRIIERVGRSAYKLALLQHWKIHNVVSVDRLELATMDPWDRRLTHVGLLATTQQRMAALALGPLA